MTPAPRPGRVTVVVASYNHAEYLPRRMESLLAQTYADLEIIVIDDRSPDESVAVLRRYESDPRVTLVVRETNAGWVGVSNQGIAMASGEYVLFANCDDACEPRMVERLVDAIQRHPSAGIGFCRSLFVDEHDKVLGEDLDIQEPAFRARCATDTLLERREMSRFLLHACVIPNLSAALFRSESFARVGALSSDFKACSDWELFFRIAREYDVAYVAEPLNLFRQHATTIRSVMKERDTYDEYFTLLLTEARTLDLSASERLRARLRVMDLWSTHLIGRSSGGWANFSYHLGRVMRHDPAALLMLAPALARRVVALVGKVLTASRGMLAAGRAQ